MAEHESIFDMLNSLPWAPVTAIAAVVSALVGVFLYVGNRRSARKLATINFLETRIQSEIHSCHRRTFLQLITAKKDLSQYVPSKIPDHLQAAAVNWMANHYEYMATWIHEGLFDETIYFRYYRSMLMKDWRHLYKYVNAARQFDEGDTLNMQYYCEFERLAKRWSNFDSWHKHNSWLGNLLRYKLWWRRRLCSEFRDFGAFR